MTREEFEREFNSRTLAYHPDYQADERPVVVLVGTQAHSMPGHTLLTSLANHLARAHRRLIFVGDLDVPLQCNDLFGSNSLERATVGLAKAINPFIDATSLQSFDGEALITLGIATEAELTLGCDGWFAHLGTSRTIDPGQTSLLGAALASILGAAAAFHRVVGRNTLPNGSYSAWEYGQQDGEPGPDVTLPIDVGRVLQIGAGAVGCAVDYWVGFMGTSSQWTVIDGDVVEVNNLNRQLLFLAEDAGFPTGPARQKSDVVAERLRDWHSVPCWYDAEGAGSTRNASFDLVLPLANERGIRPLLQARGQTVLLHGTTTPNWTALAHRHVAGHDDCIVCRLPEEHDATFACATATVGSKVQADASLPFLSSAAGLMLLVNIIKLQFGRLLDGPSNFASVDFLEPEPLIRELRWACRDACRMWLPPEVRLRIAEEQRFRSLDAAMSGMQAV